FPQLSSPFTRFGATDGSIDNVVAQAAFAGDANHHGSAVNQSGEHIVFQVVDEIKAEGSLEANANTQLENEVRVGMYGDFVSSVRDEAGLRINQQALQQTLELNGL